MSSRDTFDFDVGDWMKDPAVNVLRPSTRGIWFDALCHMHNLGRSGELSGTLNDLAKLCRCTPSEMRVAVDELKLREAAEVTERLGIVTLINRRMKRIANTRKSWRNRKMRQRSKTCHANVTPDVTPQSRECHANPPNGFPPNNPSSLSPPTQPVGRGSENARPAGTPGHEPLDREIREFCGSSRMLDWSPKLHHLIRKLVLSEGWDQAKRLIDQAIGKGATMPVSYALGMVEKQQRNAGAGQSRNGAKPYVRSAVAANGREDS